MAAPHTSKALDGRGDEDSQSFASERADSPDKVKDLENQRQPGVQSDSDTDDVGRQIEMEAGNSIKYRTCSWQKTAALLFSEYICLAIMSFPWSYSVLGLVPGLILTVVIAGIVLYTSLIIWRFCLRHPHVRDVCDIGQHLFWGSNIAWYLTAVMFLLNNTFIQGLHCLVGAEWLNTVSSHGTCTIVFSLITAIVSFVCSLPRTFSTLSKIATFSALFTFISVILAVIFTAIEDHPAGYTPAKGDPIVTAVPVAGTTFVSGVNAFLNISYTFIGQITLPSFIAEMKEPKDFWKSVTAVTVAEIIVFSLVGSIVYAVVGWAAWAGILAVLWIGAFIIAEVIPFFSDLRMRREDYGPNFYKNRGIRGWIGFIVNVGLIFVGLFFLGPGTYAAVDSVVLNYQAGTVGSPFSCADNGL